MIYQNRIKIALLALVIVLQAAALSGQEALPDSARSDTSRISIVSSTPGFDVYLDGALIGKTPIHHFAVDSGTHTVLLRRTVENSWMNTNWTKTVKIAKADTAEVFAQLNRHYLVKSEPFGAEVYWDGVLQGTTPAILEFPDTLTAKVTLVLEGYRPATVVCRPDGLQYLETTLVEDQVFTSQKKQIQQQAEIQNAKDGRRALIFAGLTIISGFTAIALKTEADDAYDQYVQSGDPAAREGFFDRTEKYDRYTSVAMGAFQANLVLSLYFFYKSQK